MCIRSTAATQSLTIFRNTTDAKRWVNDISEAFAKIRFFRLLNSDPSYVKALQDSAYRQLDKKIINLSSNQMNISINDDKVYELQSYARWYRGSLKILSTNVEFVVYSEPQVLLDFPLNVRKLIFDDMSTYGYLLPHWIPLLSRFQCRKSGADGSASTTIALHRYHPYHGDCISKWSNSQHFE